MKSRVQIHSTLAFLVGFSARLVAADPFKITVVDEQTGRGVPLAQLETVNHTRWWTDSNGIIAFDEPGLMGQEVYFHVQSHGYEYPKDFFSNRGLKLKPVDGGSATIKITRLNIAERLYRVTGEGIYRDSALTGHPVPLKRPLLNGQVMGQDTVIATLYRGKIYWFWGDTDRASYPLGNFGASGATSELPGQGGLDPGIGVDLDYFVDQNGFSKPMCPLPGKGLRWIEGLMTLPGDAGRERLVARVANVRDLGHVNDWHLMVFNDEKAVFESVQRWDSPEGHDSSHPFRANVNGVEYIYLYPNWRIKADLRSLSNLDEYEALTCLTHDGKINDKQVTVDRDANRSVRYSWKAGADRLHAGRIRELIAQGKLQAGENWLDLHDFETGGRIQAGRGSVYWNEYRQRWVMLISAQAGEIWFAEGDTPSGPRVYARRVVAHDNYNFYNPTQHSFFDQERGRLVYFEGTYTASFSAAKEKTPRYDYNQIMYRLALDDSRLGLPAPVYRLRSAGRSGRLLMREGIEAVRAWDSIEEIAFFAVPPSRQGAGLVPVYAGTENGGTVLQTDAQAAPRSGTGPLFFALPATNGFPANSLNGAWRGQGKTSDGTEFSFVMDLIQQNSSVEAVSKDLVARGSGSFKQGQLTLNITRENHPFLFTAALKGQALAGNWKQADGTLQGTWSAEWIDPTPREHRSSATVALYEYRRVDGRRFYSVNGELMEPGLKRASEPLCRVWRNPLAVLVLDPVIPSAQAVVR